MSTTDGTLALKPDWAETKERFIAWWNREPVDRLFLGVMAPRDVMLPAPDPAMSPDAFYLDANARIAQAENYIDNYQHLGAAYPNASADLGPGSLALYLGSEPGYAWDTVWFYPSPAAVAGILPDYDARNAIWVGHQQVLEQLAAAAKGRYYANIPDLVEGLDIVAALRGTEQLLADLIDNPDWVHACQQRVTDLYFRYYDRCFDICKDEGGGASFTAFQIWAPGRLSKLQCDFSAMISPAMFDEFELPYLRQMCEKLDYILYHLDGPTAIPHLDSLLSLERLNAIQWVPGDGANNVWHEEWYPLYRRILDGGKGLQLHGCYDPDGIDRLVRTFGVRGIYLHIWGVPSRQAGEDLLARAERDWRG